MIQGIRVDKTLGGGFILGEASCSKHRLGLAIALVFYKEARIDEPVQM